MNISLVDYFKQFDVIQQEIEGEASPFVVHHELKVKKSKKRKLNHRRKCYVRSGAWIENHYRHIARVDNHMHVLKCTINNSRRHAFKKEVDIVLDEFYTQMIEKKKYELEVDMCWAEYEYIHRRDSDYFECMELSREYDENAMWVEHISMQPQYDTADFDVDDLPEDEWRALKNFICAE